MLSPKQHHLQYKNNACEKYLNDLNLIPTGEGGEEDERP